MGSYLAGSLPGFFPIYVFPNYYSVLSRLCLIRRLLSRRKALRFQRSKLHDLAARLYSALHYYILVSSYLLSKGSYRKWRSLGSKKSNEGSSSRDGRSHFRLPPTAPHNAPLLLPLLPLCSPLLPCCSLLLPRCSLAAPLCSLLAPSVLPLKRPCSFSRTKQAIS